jgi:hypothetical protein
LAGHGETRAAFTRGGKNCRDVYPALTISAHPDTKGKATTVGDRIMRIYGPGGTALAAAAPAKRTASGSFAVSDQTETQATNTAPALRMVGGIDALIALQGVEDQAERRRRSVKSGRNALDVLDELKVGLLGGPIDSSALLRLKSAAAELKGRSGDPGLDGVLAEIDLRVEVELAKAGIR